jgi:hypothetical protein
MEHLWSGVDGCFQGAALASPGTRMPQTSRPSPTQTTFHPRTDPAEGRWKPPQAPGNPRKPSGEKVLLMAEIPANSRSARNHHDRPVTRRRRRSRREPARIVTFRRIQRRFRMGSSLDLRRVIGCAERPVRVTRGHGGADSADGSEVTPVTIGRRSPAAGRRVRNGIAIWATPSGRHRQNLEDMRRPTRCVALTGQRRRRSIASLPRRGWDRTGY